MAYERNNLKQRGEKKMILFQVFSNAASQQTPIKYEQPFETYLQSACENSTQFTDSQSGSSFKRQICSVGDSKSYCKRPA